MSEKERVRRHYARLAPRYDRAMGVCERVLLGGTREWACGRARGEVLEVAAGTGLNLPHYPADVRLTGIELSPEMVELARERAKELGREADLRVGDAESLDLPDASFDTVVCTFGLCTIPDDRRAVGEMRRVLRPGGRLILAEHVRSPVGAIRAVQRILNPITVRLQSDHLLREPLEHVRASGLEVQELERSKLGIVELLAARRPESDRPSAER